MYRMYVCSYVLSAATQQYHSSRSWVCPQLFPLSVLGFRPSVPSLFLAFLSLTRVSPNFPWLLGFRPGGSPPKHRRPARAPRVPHAPGQPPGLAAGPAPQPGRLPQGAEAEGEGVAGASGADEGWSFGTAVVLGGGWSNAMKQKAVKIRQLELLLS